MDVIHSQLDGTAIRDVSMDQNTKNTMSFYLPKDLDPNADNEAILIIHGGSWTKEVRSKSATR